MDFAAFTKEGWMGRVGRSVVLAASMLVSAAACTADSGGGDDAGSCAYQIRYQGRTYSDVANVHFAVGKKLGDATSPPCDDTGGEAKDPATTVPAYAVDGLSPEVAIAVGDTPSEAKFVAVYSGSELPPEVRKLLNGS
ncbi:DUF6281 family protein [Streptomyces sp. NPDC102394]|uniref:DUF6281 family protein n=1 Tax=Streptomyces sp. NPDC102394 TaxID=3366167 RepID=UPI0038048DD7